MSRWTLPLISEAARDKARKWLARAPLGFVVEFRQPTRSLESNNLMWSRLSDLSEQVTWHGERLSPPDWKTLLTASLHRCRFVPGIDPGTVVPLGLRTSTMTKAEMSDLLELIAAFGAERGVKFSDTQEDAA